MQVEKVEIDGRHIPFAIFQLFNQIGHWILVFILRL